MSEPRPTGNMRKARNAAAAHVAVLVAVLALAWPPASAAQDHGGDCDKNHYILNLKCWGAGGDQPFESGDATKIAIGLPTGLAIDAAGNVYFSTNRNAIYRIETDGMLTHVAGNGTRGHDGDGGPAVRAQIYLQEYWDADWGSDLSTDLSESIASPNGLAVDIAGNLYIADAYNGRIRKVDVSGVITTIAGHGMTLAADGWGGYSSDYFRGNGDGGPARDAMISVPRGIAIDAAGTLHFTNDWNDLRTISVDGRITTRDTRDAAPTICQGICGSGQIALDVTGRVIVPDGYCRVRAVALDGSIETVAGDDSPGKPSSSSSWLGIRCPYVGDSVPAKAAGLGYQPGAVATDVIGNLYIADTAYNCVRVVNPAGTIRTVAGSCGGTWMFTGVPLRSPQGIAVDHLGNLYIADTGNARILKRTPDGTVTTIAGLMPAIPLGTP